MYAAVISTLIFASPGASAHQNTSSRFDTCGKIGFTWTKPHNAITSRSSSSRLARSVARSKTATMRLRMRFSRACLSESWPRQSVLLGSASGRSVAQQRQFDSASDPCSTFERCNYLAGHRLKLAGYFERKRNEWKARAQRLERENARVGASQRRGPSDTMSPRSIICSVFGAHCSEAISVATCESHLNIWAVNGQYVNLFQMGYNERRHYGWHVAGSPAILAARAAYRYFLATGSDWSPWQCKP